MKNQKPTTAITVNKKAEVAQQKNYIEYLTEAKSLEFSNSVSLAEVFKPAYSPLSCLVKKENGAIDKSPVYNLLEAYVVLITGYFGSDWREDQESEFAKAFYREFYFFNQADLKIFYNRITVTEFKEYGTISPKILMNELIRYREERFEAAEIQSRNDKAKRQREAEELNPGSRRNSDIVKTLREFINGPERLIEP